MVRAPPYQKMGLKKGPWSVEEDRKLISYIIKYGIWNWQQMPNPAGLLRSGKSCRQRWMNYLRPTIKRGKFSKEEEETIIKLHEMFGNRWSEIAARLPGRTGNKIRNVCNTYLKKRLKNYQTISNTEGQSVTVSRCDSNALSESEPMNFSFSPQTGSESRVSPQDSSSDFSSCWNYL